MAHCFKITVVIALVAFFVFRYHDDIQIHVDKATEDPRTYIEDIHGRFSEAVKDLPTAVSNMWDSSKDTVLSHPIVTNVLSTKNLKDLNLPVIVSPDVENALEYTKLPVVALESTIISHGLPYPDNIRVALEIEEVVRQYGAIPATIGILDGQIIIGMTEEQIRIIGDPATHVNKVSRRDLGYVVSQRGNGATTVSATMLIADLVGIRVFATGGIGGVHRGAEETWDISADLDEFTKSEVLVVSAGAKSVLDLPLTLEALETRGVPVVGYMTTDFPSFYSRTSGLKTPLSVNSAEEAAAFFKEQTRLSPHHGMMLANPIPFRDEIQPAVVEGWLEEAFLDAEAAEIKGREVTPFLLSRLLHISKGKSLEANISLVKNNARVAAEIAVALVRDIHEQ